MSTALKLDSMTLEEKLAAMDLLWSDLSARAAVESPEWHGEVLTARLEQARSGPDKFEDWKSVIDQLKDELHANQTAKKRES